jgi:hypothetical protein
VTIRTYIEVRALAISPRYDPVLDGELASNGITQVFQGGEAGSQTGIAKKAMRMHGANCFLEGVPGRYGEDGGTFLPGG